MFNKEGLVDKKTYSDNSNRWLYKFDNMYGASVIDYGYGREEGLYEVAIIYWDGFNFEISYSTDLFPNGVIGWCNIEEVNRLLEGIKTIKGWNE